MVSSCIRFFLDCGDRLIHCSHYVGMGYCKSQMAWMKYYCPKSCKYVCKNSCKDCVRKFPYFHIFSLRWTSIWGQKYLIDFFWGQFARSQCVHAMGKMVCIWISPQSQGFSLAASSWTKKWASQNIEDRYTLCFKAILKFENNTYVYGYFLSFWHCSALNNKRQQLKMQIASLFWRSNGINFDVGWRHM